LYIKNNLFSYRTDIKANKITDNLIESNRDDNIFMPRYSNMGIWGKENLIKKGGRGCSMGE